MVAEASRDNAINLCNEFDYGSIQLYSWLGNGRLKMAIDFSLTNKYKWITTR